MVTELSAEISGRLCNHAGQRSDLPGVGDFVALRLALTDGTSTIEAVLPRTTALIRRASGENRPQLLAANVDVVFIVTAPDGDFNLARIERLLALVRGSGAAPVIILNKEDLAGDVPVMAEQIASVSQGAPLHVISARARDCIGPIEGYFNINQTVGIVGSSGVGKSTLTNELLGRGAQATVWLGWDPKLQREVAFQNSKEDPRAQSDARKLRVRRNKQHRAEMKFRRRLE